MKKQSGFTLLEVLITLTIGAILVSLAVPSFRTGIENNRVTTEINQVVTALNLARLEAIKRGESVSVCTSTDGASCLAGSWGDGFILFIDESADAIVDTGDEVLKVFSTFSTGSDVAATGSTVTYNSDGRTNAVFGSVFSLSIQPDTCTDSRSKNISVLSTGRPEVISQVCF